MPYLTLGSVYIVAYVIARALLRGHPFGASLLGDIAMLLPALAVCGTIVRRRHDWDGVQRLFWDTFLLGLIVWSVGTASWAVNLFVPRGGLEPWHTLFGLAAGIGPIVAMLVLPHLGRREPASGGLRIVLVSYAILGGFLYAYFVLVPAVIGSAQADRAMLVLMQIQRGMLVVGLGALTWMTAGRWRVTYFQLFIGAFLALALRILAGVMAGDAFHMSPFFDLAWIVLFVCYGSAAASAPASVPHEEEAAPRGTSSTLLLVVPVLLIPGAGYGLVHILRLGDPGDSFRIVLTTLTTVAGLGLLALRVSGQSDELQRTDARLRLLAAAVEQTEDLILITDGGGAIVQANAAAVRALGYSRAELRTMRLEGVIERGFEDTIDIVGAAVRKDGVWRGTLVHRRKDGSTFPAANTVVTLKTGDGRVTHFVGVGRDITQELQLRDQLVNSERLSAIGELVAGVAHELNNPLQTIIGSVELLMDADGGDPTKDLQLVRQEATRAGQIVRNLLAFVRRSTPDRRPEDLNQIVRATVAVREHHLAQQNIALELHLDSAPVVSLVNREEIQQILLNLVLNAEHAIGEAPGAIRIRTEAGEGVHSISVTDSGPGVKAELRGRIFEPFFTTKDVGQGTGLGLSISHGIATAHGGTLELYPSSSESSGVFRRSAAGVAQAGACFRLTLPAYAASTGTPAQAVAAAFKLK